MSVNGRTSFQRFQDTGQPYTRVFAQAGYEEVEIPHPSNEGETLKGLKQTFDFAVRGYTYEESLQPVEKDEGGDPTYELDWLEHDLGQQPTLGEAHQVAAEWRESLSGVYEIR